MKISMSLVGGRLIRVRVFTGVHKGMKKEVYLHKFEDTVKKSKEKIYYALFGEQPKQNVEAFVNSVKII